MDREVMSDVIVDVEELGPSWSVSAGVGSLFEQYDEPELSAANDDIYENLYAMPS